MWFVADIVPTFLQSMDSSKSLLHMHGLATIKKIGQGRFQNGRTLIHYTYYTNEAFSCVWKLNDDCV